MRWVLAIAICIVAMGFYASAFGDVPMDPVTSTPEDNSGTTIVDVTGYAPAHLMDARQEATEDALRRAVEQGGGIYLQSETRVSDYTLIDDQIQSKTEGFVQKWAPLATSANQDGLYVIRIRAWVKTSGIKESIDGLKTLIKRNGRPKFMVVADTEKGVLDDNLTVLVETALHDRGFDLISHGAMKQDQKDEAEQAAHGDHNYDKAAAIAAECQADYIVVVDPKVIHYPPQSAYGITTYPVDVSVLMQVISTDTSMVLAPVKVEEKSNGENVDQTIVDATNELTTTATKKAIGLMADDWLEPLHDLQISAYGASTDKIQSLVGSLQRIKGVQNVSANRIDEHGMSEISLQTPYRAGNTVLLLKQLMALPPIKSTNGRISMDFSNFNYDGDGGVIAAPHKFLGRLIALIAIGVTSAVAAGVALFAWLRGRAEDAKSFLTGWDNPTTSAAANFANPTDSQTDSSGSQDQS